MMTCHIAKDLIERFVDGTIDAGELEKLKTHTQTCEACRQEFHRCSLMQEVVEQALSPRTSAAQARTQIVDRLSVERLPAPIPIRAGWMRASLAAGILVAVGLSAGFVLGRLNPAKPRDPLSGTPVSIRVSGIEGTVLVRHKGSDVWQNLSGSSGVYLGDTFHSAAGSGFVLTLEDHKSTIRVSPNSMLALTSYDGETQFFLERGGCKAALESPHGPFFIRTPHGRVEALGTEFTVTVD
jgi:predicted anti-sigma-YlaC factor YlaD